MNFIRNATENDVYRIAEIIVFNNRMNFFPIFKDEQFSFKKMQVIHVANDYLKNKEKLQHIFIYDDGVIKGFIHTEKNEIIKLYVDTFFQSQGIGAQLIEFAIEEKNAFYLWALEKNTRAIQFYNKHGFYETDERVLEEGTTEYLVKLKRD